MNNKMIVMVASALCVLSADLPSAYAQSTLGGAKTPQNKIGGVAKPVPVIGGASHLSSPPALPKPGPVLGMAKPGAPGPVKPNITSNAGLSSGPPRANPLVTSPNRSGPVVSSNLKCASGACSSRGPKP